MHSATAEMLYAKEAYAGMIAQKLSDTEGVPYKVVKETKGYRVIAAGGKSAPTIGTSTAPHILAKAGLKLKTATPAKAFVQNLADAVEKKTVAAILDQSQGVFHLNCVLEKETPTMIFTLIDGVKRVFGKSDLIGWDVTKDEEFNVKKVSLRMTPDKAKKWKLLNKAVQ